MRLRTILYCSVLSAKVLFALWNYKKLYDEKNNAANLALLGFRSTCVKITHASDLHDRQLNAEK